MFCRSSLLLIAIVSPFLTLSLVGWVGYCVSALNYGRDCLCMDEGTGKERKWDRATRERERVEINDIGMDRGAQR